MLLFNMKEYAKYVNGMHLY